MGYDSSSNWTQPADAITEMLAHLNAPHLQQEHIATFVTAREDQAWTLVRGAESGKVELTLTVIERMPVRIRHFALEEGPYFYDCPLAFAVRVHEGRVATAPWYARYFQYMRDRLAARGVDALLGADGMMYEGARCTADDLTDLAMSFGTGLSILHVPTSDVANALHRHVPRLVRFPGKDAPRGAVSRPMGGPSLTTPADSPPAPPAPRGPRRKGSRAP